MPQDRKAKPKKGQFFPIRFGDIVRLLKEYELKQYDGSRLAIVQENKGCEYEHGFMLLELLPKEEVVISSLPDTFGAEFAEKAFIAAFQAMAPLKAGYSDDRHYSYFTAYLTADKTVVITRIDLKAKHTKKYRGDDKLKNAMRTWTSDKETVVDTIFLKTADVPL